VFNKRNAGEVSEGKIRENFLSLYHAKSASWRRITRKILFMPKHSSLTSFFTNILLMFDFLINMS
jgi:hypothetical protein